MVQKIKNPHFILSYTPNIKNEEVKLMCKAIMGVKNYES